MIDYLLPEGAVVCFVLTFQMAERDDRKAIKTFR